MKQQIQAIEKAAERLSVNEIKEQLRPFFKGMHVVSPVLQSGEFVYRARKLSGVFNKARSIRVAELSYPPSPAAKMGRANREGQSVFYCSTSKEAVFFEIRALKPGDELILSFWQTTDRLIVNNIGYTQELFTRLGAKRELPAWSVVKPQLDHETIDASQAVFSKASIKSILAHDENTELRQALSNAFMTRVDDDDAGSYKLTTAIAELHLGTIDSDRSFAGVMYPACRMWANGDNIALTRSTADDSLELQMAKHVRIDSITGLKIETTQLDAATGLDEDGNLEWLGRLPNWQLTDKGQVGTMTLRKGHDRFGDYSIDKNGEAVHWELTDAISGNVIEPK